MRGESGESDENKGDGEGDGGEGEREGEGGGGEGERQWGCVDGTHTEVKRGTIGLDLA